MFCKDSTFYKNEYKENLIKSISALSNKYDVKTIEFGDKIKNNIGFNFNDKLTNISSVMNEINNTYLNRNVGAIVLATDGIYNQGSNPIYIAKKSKVPIYPIALGDTSIKKDLILAKIDYNKTVYLGNKFPLIIYVNAKELKGTQTRISVLNDNNNIFSREIEINNNNFSIIVPVEIETKKVGIQHYKIKLDEINGEYNTKNNSNDLYMNVIDERQKVLILSESPHPDVAAIKNSIETNETFEVENYLIDQFNQPVKKYDLLIFHQLPSARFSSGKLFNEIKTSDIPVLFILGSQTNYPIFNAFQTGITIAAIVNKFNTSDPILETGFTLFTISDNLKNYIRNFPPLITAFGDFKTSNSSNILIYQKIGLVQTKNPLISFNQIGDKKFGVIAGEGIWRWKLRDFSEHNNNSIFNELINKIIQYLSISRDKNFFRIKNKNNFAENENIEFNAELYNDTYELINNPDVIMDITNQENKNFSYTFDKTSNAYQLNVGIFPAGSYKFSAKVKLGNKTFTHHGAFSVSPILIESTNLVADHHLLFNIAKKTNGKLFYPNQFNQLETFLLNKEDIKPVSYTEKKLTDLIHIKWILFLILLLLTIEWFIRKRNGTY